MITIDDQLDKIYSHLGKKALGISVTASRLD